ncbi:MAG: alkaline phosphatase family protein, partial [Acidobacteriota bacterium]
MIAGMDTPSTRSPGFCHPPELAEELRRAGIDYVLDVPNLQILSRRDPARGARLARRMIDVRAQAIKHLMSTRPWDVLMAVFVVTDRLQHHYWPAEESDLLGADWKAVRDVYRRIDTVVGDLVARVGSPCHVLVVSDHGFGPARVAPRGLNRLFAELDLLRFSQMRPGSSGQLLGFGLKMGRRVIPQTWQRSLAKAFPRLYTRAVHEQSVAHVDWSHTLAFATAHGHAVFLNRNGAADGGGYERLREQVKSILEGLVDAESHR